MSNRRKFSRILFDTPAVLNDGQKSWDTRILDLSLNGALLEAPLQFNPQSQPLTLAFELPDASITVSMQAQLIHNDENQIGLRCVHIDLDSISHLRRVVELNLGDASLLYRELEHFIESHERED